MTTENNETPTAAAVGGADTSIVSTQDNSRMEDMSAELSASLFPESESAGEKEPAAAAGAPSDTTETTPKPAEKKEGTPAPAPAAATKPAAPKTWRPEAAAAFEKADPVLQQEILKREEDMFKGLEGYKAEAGIGKAIKDIMAPYLPLLQQHNVNPLEQISGLMRAHSMLSTGTPEQKKGIFMHLLKDYGVDLGIEAPYVDPEVAALQQKLNSVESKLEGQEKAQAASIRSKLEQELTAFTSDPAHSLFDEVANDIALYVREGATLQQAYDKAVWANPSTRAKEQARLTAEASAKQKAEAATRAAAARKASSVNVRTTPKSASSTAPLGSMDDTLQEALAAIKSRA